MKKLNLDKFYTNSKFDFYKHFWKFVIAPAVIIIAAIVLLCTVGFNAQLVIKISTDTYHIVILFLPLIHS